MDKMNHDMLSKKGTYRKFLDNPDNIILAGKKTITGTLGVVITPFLLYTIRVIKGE